MLFANTPFETVIKFSEDVSMVMILGCGFAIIHNKQWVENGLRNNYKIHKMFGRAVGIAVFSYQV